MKYDYKAICRDHLLGNLSDRTRGIIVRRFGLQGEKETLETVGAAYGITRERVRQIENDGLQGLKKAAAGSACRGILKEYADYLKNNSSLKREDLLLSHFGGNDFKNYVFFLLTVGELFSRMPETDDYHAFWTIDKSSAIKADKAVHNFIFKLQEKKQPLALPASAPVSYAEISKNILKGPQGLYGLRDWPEVNPRGIKDKAYIILKEKETPLHFTEVATLINSSSVFDSNKKVIPQTVHNELIKDSRFVLVGRGLYGLKERGYESGVVRNVIYREIKSSGGALAKDEIVRKVLDQRKVQTNTILLNLQNKKYFAKTAEGRYTTLETKTHKV